MSKHDFKFNIIASVSTLNYAIGNNGDIPWESKQDHIHFETLTKSLNNDYCKNAVVIGNNTWKAIGETPFNERITIVVTRTSPSGSNVGGTVVFVKSFYCALMLCKMRDDIENCFVIGGYQLFKTAMQHPWLQSVYITEIETEKTLQYDRQFPHHDKLNLSNFEIFILGIIKDNNKRLIYKRYDKLKKVSDWTDHHPFAWR